MALPTDTLLDICTSIADEAGVTIGSSIVTSNAVAESELYAMCNRVIEQMSDAYPWPQLFKSGSITLVAGQSGYALPADFSYYHFDTFWNQSSRWRVIGPMSPQEYGEIQGYGLTRFVYDRFQVRGVADNQLFIQPIPTADIAGQIIVFEYLADRSVRPKTWVTSTVFAAGAYCFYNGNYYTTTAGGTTGATPPTHTSGSVSDGAVTWAFYSGSYSKFLADTDIPVLSTRVLEQGVLERYSVKHGMNIDRTFERDLAAEYARTLPGKTIYTAGHTSRYMIAESGRVSFGSSR